MDDNRIYRMLPGVDKLLNNKIIAAYIREFGKDLVLNSIRKTLEHYREGIKSGKPAPNEKEILDLIYKAICISGNRSLKKVYNATGIIIHTNMGRAPLGKAMLKESAEIIEGYCNIEFDLEKATRGNRNDHAKNILKFITGAEDILIVNNNAAAVMLILRTFARNREVIVSRGELIEIGGSFRIPEIMQASDCKMIEVGTTNKTRAGDYEKAINRDTAALFKAHKSNYAIRGFADEVDIKGLVKLGKKYGIPVIYDIGSGMLRKPANLAMGEEPDVREAIKSGADLVCFSGDKLMGGPQAGIIAGTAEKISMLKNEPMFRALRVCKITLAFLETASRYYLNDDLLKENSLIFKIMSRKAGELKKTAGLLKNELATAGIESEIIKSNGQFGGGSMPDTTIPGYAVKIRFGTNKTKAAAIAEKSHRELLIGETPVLGVLKSGELCFDVLTVFPDDIPVIAGKIITVLKDVNRRMI
ncbi:MAG: L-seryl-tRNA(Sec) selenium transferase [Bacteroidota bacterium]